MNSAIRTYLFQPRPRHRETIDSFSRRLLEANFDSDTQEQLISTITNSRRVADRAEAWTSILKQKTGRDTFHLTPDPSGWLRHRDGTSCITCADGLNIRAMCTLCARGEFVEQSPHFDTLVCLRHRRWVGLTNNPTDQHAAPAAVVAAGATFNKLRAAGRIDVRLFSMLTAALDHDRASSVSPAEDFVTAVALADSLTSEPFLRALTTRTGTYAGAHTALNDMITAICGAEQDYLTRAVWLYLRPTFWALHHSIRTRSPFSSAWAHDLPVKATVMNQLAEATTTTEPFEKYLEVTGDDQLSLSRFGLESPAAAALRTVQHPHTGKKHLQICAAGHQFEAAPFSMASIKNGKAPTCPICRHRIIVPGLNDLGTVHAKIAAQFDTSRNGGLTAENISASSNTRFWWTCPEDHHFQSTPNNRIYAKGTCPICQNKVCIPGVNDVSTTHPHLVADWHPAWLAKEPPTRYTAGSKGRIGWLCPEGHTYELEIWEKAQGKGCPSCQKNATRAAKRDFASTHPELAAEWHPTFNRGHLPSEYSAGSAETVYWLCPIGHHYLQRIERRVAGYKCSVCSRRTLVPGVNDLATTDPELVREWHSYLNWKKPNEIFPGTALYTWRCLREKHVYEQSVPHRRKSKGCPKCPTDQRILAQNE